jgi:hypothetical protein
LLAVTLISLLVPTRGRPQNVLRLAGSVHSTNAAYRWEIVWSVDDDDLSTIEIIQGLDTRFHRLVVTPRAIPTVKWNEAWRAASGDIFGMMGDDVVFRTDGWDALVEGAFAQYPDRLVIVYGPDGFRNELHASHPFLSREWADLFGRATVEHFSADWCDTWTNEVAEANGRRHYIPELWIEHLHPDNPALGVEFDQTYQENRARNERDRNEEKYAAMQAERDIDAERLRRAINAD